MQDDTENTLRPVRRWQHYVVVLTLDEVLGVQRVLSKLGIALDGTTLRVHEGTNDDDVLFDITPREIATRTCSAARRAHASLARYNGGVSHLDNTHDSTL